MTKPLTLTFEGWTLYRESGELKRDGKRVRLKAHHVHPSGGPQVLEPGFAGVRRRVSQ